MRQVILGISVLLLVAWSAWAQPNKANVLALTTHKLPGPSNLLAIEPESGATVFGFPETKKLVLVRRIAAGFKVDAEFDAQGEPTFIAWTRIGNKPTLVLNTAQSSNVVLLDLDLKQIGSIALGRIPMRQLAVAAGDGRYAYYMEGVQSSYSSRLYRMDLVDRKDDVPVETGDRFDGQWIAVSPNGQYLYSHRLHTSPTGINAWKIHERSGKPKLENLIDQHDSASGYLCDSQSRYVANTQGVWTTDMSRQVAKTPGKPIGFIPGSPYYFCGQSGFPDKNFALSVVSLNSSTVVRRYSVTFERAENSRPDREAPCAINPAQKSVVAVNGSQYIVIPFEMIGPLDEPTLEIDLPPEVLVELNKPLSLPVKAVEKDTQVVLESAPTGMSYESGLLRWSPTEQQVGIHRVSVLLTKGDAKRLVQLRFNVQRPTIVLPFKPANSRLTPDGKRLIILSETSDSARNSGQNDPTQIAVVDLIGAKVLQQAEFPQQYNWVAVNDSLIMLGNSERAQTTLLQQSDLKPLSTRDIKGRLGIVGLTNEFGFFSEQTGQEQQTTAFRLSDGSVVRRLPQGGLVRITPLGLCVGHTLVDPKSLEPLLLTNASNIPVFQTGHQPRAPQRNFGTRFDSAADNDGIYPPFGRPAAAAVLEQVPAVIRIARTVFAQPGSSDPSQAMALDLSVRQIGNRDAQETVRVAELSPRIAHGMEYWCGVLVHESADECKAVVVHFDNVTVLDLKPLLARLPKTVPPYVKQVDAKIQIDSKGVTKLSAKFAGGNGPLRYVLEPPIEGMTIDPATGEVSINADSIGARATQQLGARLQPGVSPIDQYADARATFKAFAGREPAGVPVAIPVNVKVFDAADGQAGLWRVVLMDIPADDVRVAGPAPAPVGAGGDQRLLELERENAALRAQVQLLRELLANPSGKVPATQPGQ